MLVGCVAWLGFIVPTHYNGVLFSKKPREIFLIDVGYYLLSMLLMGGMLARMLPFNRILENF